MYSSNVPGSSIPAVYKTREGHTVTARGNRIVWSDAETLRGRLGYLPAMADRAQAMLTDSLLAFEHDDVAVALS